MAKDKAEKLKEDEGRGNIYITRCRRGQFSAKDNNKYERQVCPLKNKTVSHTGAEIKTIENYQK